MAKKIKEIVEETAWYVPFFMTFILGIATVFLFKTALDNRAMEDARNNDYVSRTEKEKILLIEAVTDSDDAFILANENLDILWTNPKLRKILDKKTIDLHHANLKTILPSDCCDEYVGFHFDKSDPPISYECVISVNGVETTYIITFKTIEKSWSPANDGYFVITMTEKEKIADTVLKVLQTKKVATPVVLISQN